MAIMIENEWKPEKKIMSHARTGREANGLNLGNLIIIYHNITKILNAVWVDSFYKYLRNEI